MQYLGLVGYYRRFCKNFASVAAPLTNLLRKHTPFTWTAACEHAFQVTKAMMTSSPVLQTPCYEKQFFLATDASDAAAGAVLQQEAHDGSCLHPISFFSRKFTAAEKNYSTVEKETLALVLALKHFDVYLCVVVKPIVVFTDHNPLVFLSKMTGKNQRLTRWSLLLQEYRLEIKHCRGRDNVVADYLSRNCF